MIAVTMAALIVFVFVGVLEPMLIAVGLQSPPEVVVEQPDLFRDYALFEYLDAIEHFDAVNSTEPRRAIDGPPRG
jgi:hypothetical protein